MSYQDWQWDGMTVQIPGIREEASLQIRLGGLSSLTYTIPMVANSNGYLAELDIHLAQVAVTTSLNDMGVLNSSLVQVQYSFEMFTA